MRLHTERSVVERSNVGKEKAFQIKTTAKAFDILSSGLYTDNILAIVRELSCNAYDAHVAAGKKDIPFEIHIPNSMEPWFAVKDDGIGLSDDEVMDLYTTYFDSTKTDSNDYIGALGLGSKSPFSYTNAFEVIARYEGKRRTYSVFISEEGVPTIAKMAEVNTDECNGLEVKVTVKAGDFYEFQNKTSKALKWFEVKPNVIGAPHFEFEKIADHRMKGDRWHLLPRGYNDPRMTAVQGNVAYKVDAHQLGLDSETQSLLDNGHLVCFFEIGELEVAASREEIRYDNRSKEALLEGIQRFREEIVVQIEKQADTVSKSFWFALLELNDISKKMFGSPYGLRKFLKDNGTDHKVLKQYVESGGVLDVPRLHGWDLIIYHPGGRYGRGANLSRKQVGETLEPKGDMAVFVNDIRIGGVGRLNKFIKTTNYTEAFTIKRVKDAHYMKEDKNGDLQPILMKEKDYTAEFKKLIKALGDPDVKYVSKDTEKVKRMANGNTTLPIFQSNGLRDQRYYSAKDKVDWQRVDPDDFEIEDGGLYFTLRNGARIMTEVDGNPKEVTWNARNVESNIATMVALINKHYRGFDFSAKDVYAVGSMAEKKIRKMDNWYNIFDLVRAIVPKYEDAITFFASYRKTPDDLGIKNLLDEKVFTKRIKELDKKSVFRKNVETILKDHDKYADDQVAADFLRDFDADYGAELFEGVGTPYFKKGAFNVYPMLTFVGTIYLGSYNRTNLDVLFDYIKMVDRS